MKNIFFSFLLITACSASAQLSDDVPDTRSKAESFAKLPKNEIRTDLSCFTMGGIDESVGKGEMKKIGFTTASATSMSFEGDNIKAIVSTAPFDASKHKLQYSDQYLIKIDRRTYYGGYSELPKTYISQLTLIIDKDTVAIPPAAYADLYNLNIAYKDKVGKERSTNAIYLSKYGNRVYFYLLSKDQSGSYEVTFIIQDKKYVRRVLDYGFL